MGAIAQVVGKMPFSGRAAVENSYFNARSETRDVDTKLTKCAKSAGFLAIFAFLHGVQAKLGIRDFTHDFAEYQATGSITSAVESTISGLYTLAMSAVTYTQAQLMGKTLFDGAQFAYRDATGKPQDERRKFEATEVLPREVLFTLAGQMIFLAQFDRSSA